MAVDDVVQVFTLGGNPGKVLDGSGDNLVPSDGNPVETYLISKMGLGEYVKVSAICNKDSGNLTSDDRGKLREGVESSPYKRIVAVQGLDTALDTIEFLEESLKGTDKTVVITGGKKPLEDQAYSDSGFQIGGAVFIAKQLDSGIYLALDTRAHSAGQLAAGSYAMKAGRLVQG